VTGRNVVGVAADCDIVLTDPYLSSKHMVIRHENGEFMLIDLDSTNGTFVNDKRVNKQELIDNDKVRLGRTEMKFKSLF
jgi:pSer/pThr/pTyr-binding forkhead associated (FHA) protein